MTQQSVARLRNTRLVKEVAEDHVSHAIERGLMQVSLEARDGRRVRLPGGQWVHEFINCSYLGLDLRPELLERANQVMREWGVHLCCARTRFSIGPASLFEAELSKTWGGHAITFPSVTTSHMSTMPLLASAEFGVSSSGSVTFLFDKHAHASMQYLRPILAAEHRVDLLPHNDLEALEQAVRQAHARGDGVVYVADGVYSMGGLCPIEELLALAQRLDFLLYIDDAHGTSIYGEVGEGSVLERLGRQLPPNVVVAFSLSKGFGCNGGGVLLPSARAERAVRSFGMTYAFSAPLDFSVVGAGLAALELHRDGTVRALQGELRRKVKLFDELTNRNEPFSPIRMVPVGDERRCIELAEALKERGYFVSSAFFPVVRRGAAQLRLCLGVGHDDEVIQGLARTLRELELVP